MVADTDFIVSTDDPQLNNLCRQMQALSNVQPGGSDSDPGSLWPAKQLDLIGQFGVYRWFIPESLGGAGWTNSAIIEGYIKLSAACLTSTFILTQRVAAIRRICASENLLLKNRLIAGLLTGDSPATVGISHLTTSRRHVGKPALSAAETSTGFRINGFSPWVTGASGADHVLLGAELEDARQILFVVPLTAPGIEIEPGFRLVGLTGSQTGPVKCRDVQVDAESVLAGPVENVLTTGALSATGGYQTSALAVGLTQAALEFIRQESQQRPDLTATLNALERQKMELQERLLSLAAGVDVCSKEALRTDANSIVLRATQAALVAAKGAGYVIGHPVGRWCQEALFFLVWSCPQSVLNANLCELAGIEDAGPIG